MNNFDATRLSQVQRINVIGTSGSGKSTLGRRLAERLALPFFEMDALYWGPNWSEPSDEEFLARLASVTEHDRWVLDGNYSRTTPTKWLRVELVIWLDMEFWRTIFRVTQRSVRRSLSGDEIWPGTGNRETLARTFFWRKSALLWAIRNYHHNRRRYAKLIDSPEFAHIRFLRLRSPSDVGEFMAKSSLVSSEEIS